MAKFNKHLNKYFLREKKIINLKLKDREISDAICNQGYIELEKPIPHGYDAEWVLREDILRREDAWAYQEALDACKASIWSKDKSFKAKNDKTKKWYVRKPDLKAINKETYEKLSPTAKKFFVEDSLYEKRYWRYGFNDKYYRCTLSYELVVKITQSFITHRREHDNILYQMESEIESHMLRLANGVTTRIWGSYRGLKYWKKEQYQKQKTNAKKEIRKQLNEE
jgi:hypothetical protein